MLEEATDTATTEALFFRVPPGCRGAALALRIVATVVGKRLSDILLHKIWEMSGQPQNANLSACGSELLRCIEELKKKRDDLARNIQAVRS